MMTHRRKEDRSDLPSAHMLVQALLPFYVEDELNTDLTDWIEAHLSTCNRCASVAGESRPLREDLAGLDRLLADARRDIPWDDVRHLFVEVGETKPIGPHRITVERVLFDHTRTLVLYRMSAAEKPFDEASVKHWPWVDMEMEDENRDRYRGGSRRQSALLGFEALPPDYEGNVILHVSLSDRGPSPYSNRPPEEPATTSFEIEVHRVPHRIKPVEDYLDRSRRVGPYRVTLENVEAGFTQTIFTVNYALTDSIKAVHKEEEEPEYIGCSWGRHPHHPNFPLAGPRPVRPAWNREIALEAVEPNPADPVYWEYAEQSWLTAPGMVPPHDHSWEFSAMAMAYESPSTGTSPLGLATLLTPGGSSALEWDETHQRIRHACGPVPDAARSVTLEVPHVFHYRLINRTLTIHLPDELPYKPGADDLESDLTMNMNREGVAVTQDKFDEQSGEIQREPFEPTIIPIWGRLRVDSVYIVLETLEIWPRSFYLRYHVRTPAGRLIVGDYPLIAILPKDMRSPLARKGMPMHLGQHRPGALSRARGLHFRHWRSVPGPIKFNIYAIGEYQGTLRWQVNVSDAVRED